MNSHNKYHFTGIGGVGMAGLAYLLKKSGASVSGCDIHPSPRTEWLEHNGIPVSIGHSADHVTPDTEVCVFTPAVHPNNPEFSAAKDIGCRIAFRGRVLAEFFNKMDGIAVCGTHGKTTTSTFIAKLLLALGNDPSWCIGGETGDFPVANLGTGKFIVEADESDGTLILYRAPILVITSIEYDHPDFFESYDEYLACFEMAKEHAGLVIESEKLDPSDWPGLDKLVRGEHNVRNARTAIEVALRLGYSREAIAEALPNVLSALPDRRFERIWPEPGTPEDDPAADVTVISDYAHHPTEIACAISMAVSLNPKRIRVMFQPHRYSRTKALLEDFPQALADADEVVLVPVYPAFEKPIRGGDIADLYREFKTTPDFYCKTLLARNAPEAWRHLYLTAQPGDIIMILGAGDLVKVVPDALRDMRSFGQHKNERFVDLSKGSLFRTGGVTFGDILVTESLEGVDMSKTIVLGMGSNYWLSDCASDINVAFPPEHCTAAMVGQKFMLDNPQLNFMVGIPGTVGGWAKMNAGAFGDSFGNHVDYVIADGKKIPASECGFGYRTSSIKGMITDVVLKPWTPPAGKSMQSERAKYAKRRLPFPPGTCGSVFKNPPGKDPAGKLLEKAGAKFLRVGGAHVWKEHANVIVAGKGCTSSDILALARLMALLVLEKYGIRLEPEIRGLEVF